MGEIRESSRTVERHTSVFPSPMVIQMRVETAAGELSTSTRLRVYSGSCGNSAEPIPRAIRGMSRWRIPSVSSTGLGWVSARPRSRKPPPRLLAKVWKTIIQLTYGEKTPSCFGKSRPRSRAPKMRKGIFLETQSLTFCRFTGLGSSPISGKCRNTSPRQSGYPQWSSRHDAERLPPRRRGYR